jgi:DNA polymerase-3 subunit chi
MKIDFYILEATSAQQAWFFTCQLLEKLYAEQKLPIFVHTNSREDAQRFDALLWTYRDDSFLPHELYPPEQTLPKTLSPAPGAARDDILRCIQIGYGESPDIKQAVLFNLGKDIPAFYTECSHVIEIVFNDPLMQQLARQRYKQYRDQGHDIQTIK